MKCPKCNSITRHLMVSVEGATNKASCYQCKKCEYFEFEKNSTEKILGELREQPLKIKQKIVKLSDNRLGMYFNKHVINSLNLKSGEEIYIMVPDKHHILLYIK